MRSCNYNQISILLHPFLLPFPILHIANPLLEGVDVGVVKDVDPFLLRSRRCDIKTILMEQFAAYSVVLVRLIISALSNLQSTLHHSNPSPT